MKLNSTQKLENGKVCLEIQVEKPEFDVAMDKAYRQNAPKITIPGFRKGKAPRAMIERMYGDSVFLEDAINIAYPDAVEAALEESGYEAVARPEVELIDADRNGFSFKVTVTVKPEVKLGKYKGVEAEKLPVSVTKKDIDAEVKALVERNARLVTVEREAKADDTVVIDFEGFTDGVAFDGGKGENYSLKLGSNQFIPGFEDQLIGAKAGSDVEVKVTFPTEYHAENLAGKDAIFNVKVHEVKETELPVADDEFAKDVSEFDTLDELKKSIEAKIRDNRERMANEAFESAVLDAIIKDMKVDVPEEMIETQLDRICNDFANRLSAQGLTLEAYLEMMQSNMEDFRKNFRDGAERQVKISLALEQIAKEEKIEPTDEDAEAEYTRLSEEFGMPADRVKGYIPLEAMKQDLYNIKATRFVVDNAVAKAPAKKTAAKKAEGEEAEKKAPAKKAASSTAKKTTSTAAKKPAAKKAEGEEAEKKAPAKKAASSTAKKTTSTAAKKPAAKKTTTTKKAADKE